VNSENVQEEKNKKGKRSIERQNKLERQKFESIECEEIQRKLTIRARICSSQSARDGIDEVADSDTMVICEQKHSRW
jgi:hypothetical protein